MSFKAKEKHDKYYEEMGQAERNRDALLDMLVSGAVPTGINESEVIQGIKDTHSCYRHYERTWFEEMQRILPITPMQFPGTEPEPKARPQLHLVK